MENSISQETQIINSIKILSKELKKIKHTDNSGTTILSQGAKLKLAELVKHVDNSIKNSPLGWIPAKEKFFTTIGIEYTFLKRKQSKVSEDEIVKKVIKLSDKRQKWNKNVHQDGRNVIEFASPIHHDWKDLLNTYRKTVAVAKKAGLVTKRHDEGSGGGHIHMGIPKHWNTKFRLKFLKILYLDLSSRPYLNWIFNEPIDDKNASSFLTQREGIRFINELNQNSLFNLNKIDCFSNKSFCVRYDEDYDTVEFRGFDMVENEQMLEEYVEFINAYFRYIYNVAKNYYYSIDYGISYYNINKNSLDKYRDKKCIVIEFNKLLKDLGLNPIKYKKYISKNYDVRIKLNQRGDTKMDYDLLAEVDFNNINKKNDYDFDEPSLDICADEPVPAEVSEQNLMAVMDADGQLHFIKNKAHKTPVVSEVGLRVRSSDDCEVDTNTVCESDFESIECEETNPQEILEINSETTEGEMTYMIGPSETKTISGVPIRNSHVDKVLVVTKKQDESLTFKYFETQPSEGNVENNLERQLSEVNIEPAQDERVFEPMTSGEAITSETSGLTQQVHSLDERIRQILSNRN